MISKQALIKSLNLAPHPEGGFYRRTYLTTATAQIERPDTTCIYFLIEHENPSHLHKVDCNEYWLYHYGTSDILVRGFSTDPDEKSSFTFQIGPNANEWQLLIPENTWFGAATIKETPEDFALLSCVCSPGFEFKGFELGFKEQLFQSYPQHRHLINEMCKE